MATEFESPASPIRSLDLRIPLTFVFVLSFVIPAPFVIGAVGSAGTPAYLAAMALFGLWFAIRLTSAWLPTLRAQHLFFAIFVICVLVSYASAMSRPIASQEVSTADSSLLRLLAFSGIFLVAADGLIDLRGLRRFCLSLGTLGAALATLALLQAATGEGFVERLSVPGLTVNRLVEPVLQRGGLVRPAATSSTPIELGVLLNICWPLLLACCITAKRFWPKLLMAALTCVVLAGVLVTLSRSAVVGLLLALSVIAIYASWLARAVMAAAALVILGAMSLFAPALFDVLGGLFLGVASDPSAQSRSDSYPVGASFIAQHPLFGRGFGTFLPAYRILDNQILLFSIEIGIVGLVAFLLLVFLALARLVRVVRSVADASACGRVIGIAVLAGMSATSASLFLFDALSFPQSAAALFLLLGVATACDRIVGHSGGEIG